MTIEQQIVRENKDKEKKNEGTFYDKFCCYLFKTMSRWINVIAPLHIAHIIFK